ncbi:MAG: LuxR C-terminal-related transcriptional regulator [Rhodomicrobiaceae bacterium]
MREKKFKKAYLIDTQPLYLDGLEDIVKNLNSDVFVEKINSLEDLSSIKISDEHQTMIVLDFLSFGALGLDVLLELRIKYPNVRIVLFNESDDENIREKIRYLGVSAFLTKQLSVSEIRSVFQKLEQDLQTISCKNFYVSVRGYSSFFSCTASHRLTKKEMNILTFLMRGTVNNEIASLVGLTESTVKSHVSSIIKKMGVINRTQVFIEMEKLRVRTSVRNSSFYSPISFRHVRRVYPEKNGLEELGMVV